MTAKRCGSAPHDGSDHFELLNPEVMFVDEVVGLSTEDIGHLDGGRPIGSRRRLIFALKSADPRWDY